jgi:hypothetical protein
VKLARRIYALSIIPIVSVLLALLVGAILIILPVQSGLAGPARPAPADQGL